MRSVEHDGADRRPRGERPLAPAPRLLLLDEPFSALDGVASDALLARLQRWLSENRVQAILATHDVTDALATSAEVLLLREGRLVAPFPLSVKTGEIYFLACLKTSIAIRNVAAFRTWLLSEIKQAGHS